MTTAIVASYNDAISVSFNSEAWFNATDVAANFGKRPVDWLKLDSTKTYISAMLEILRSEESSLLKTKRGRAVNGGETWFHPKLAVAFARWLDVRFAIWCDMQIDKILHDRPPYALKDLRSKKALPGGLTLDQIEAVKALVKARVEELPAPYQGGAAITCWSSLKSKFGVSYKAIPPEQFSEALSLVARLDLVGSKMELPTLPAPEPEAPRYAFPLSDWKPHRRIGNVAWMTYQEWQCMHDLTGSMVNNMIHTLARDGNDVSGPEAEWHAVCHLLETWQRQWGALAYLFNNRDSQGLPIRLA
jgi:hypothetical protein